MQAGESEVLVARPARRASESRRLRLVGELPGCVSREDGGGSVVGLAIVAALAAAVVAFAPFGGALAARQVLLGAADAAALAAADTASGRVSGDPCSAAASVAGALAVELTECAVGAGGVAEVTVATTVLDFPITATARAGPPPEQTHERERERERKPEPCTGAASPGATQEETTASTYR
jgi:secretion/DNA translocation related TadE-like protein